MNPGWYRVLTASILEIIWVTGLKYAQTGLEWLGTGVSWALCSYLFITASRTLPVGSSYCVFVGLGALGTIAVEVWGAGSSIGWPKLILVFTLMAGIIGITLFAEEKEEN